MNAYQHLTRERLFLPLDQDALPAGFEVEGPNHPRLVLNVMPSLGLERMIHAQCKEGGVFHGNGVAFGDAVLCMMVERMEGNFALLAVGCDHKSPQWPDIGKEDLIQSTSQRLQTLAMVLDRASWKAAGERCIKALGLTEEERGKSPTASGSSQKSTAPTVSQTPGPQAPDLK